MSALQQIQLKLKAPKSQYNSFGKYNYRNCEDILEAAKPLLAEYGAFLVLSDEIMLIGDRIYVKATASFKSKDDEINVFAYARESLEKKGMDSAQVTGAASSYARKYALNGLFLIDDTQDPDSDKPPEKAGKKEDQNPSSEPKGKKQQISPEPEKKEDIYKKYLAGCANIKAKIIAIDGNDEQYRKGLETYGLKKANDLKGKGSMVSVGKPMCKALRDYISIREEEIGKDDIPY